MLSVLSPVETPVKAHQTHLSGTRAQNAAAPQQRRSCFSGPSKRVRDAAKSYCMLLETTRHCACMSMGLHETGPCLLYQQNCTRVTERVARVTVLSRTLSQTPSRKYVKQPHDDGNWRSARRSRARPSTSRLTVCHVENLRNSFRPNCIPSLIDSSPTTRRHWSSE